MSRLLDKTFKYTNAASTDIRDTLKRFGFKPTTDAERKARQQRTPEPQPANVTPISKKSRKA
jgi:hypothetical protein